MPIQRRNVLQSKIDTPTTECHQANTSLEMEMKLSLSSSSSTSRVAGMNLNHHFLGLAKKLPQQKVDNILEIKWRQEMKMSHNLRTSWVILELILQLPKRI